MTDPTPTDPRPLEHERDELLDAIHRSRQSGTPGPWRYRPHEYTDWGEVYSGSFRLCQVRDPQAMGENLLRLHRKAETDPWEVNARRIARVPEMEARILADAATIASLEAQLAEAQAMVAAAYEAAALEVMDQERACAEWYSSTGKHASVYEQLPVAAGRIRNLTPAEALAALERIREEARREGWEAAKEAAALDIEISNENTRIGYGGEWARGWDAAIEDTTQLIRALTYQPNGDSHAKED